MSTRKDYIEVDFSRGYPVGETMYYECANCGVSILSLTKQAERCYCGNITVDPDAGRISVRDPLLVRVYLV